MKNLNDTITFPCGVKAKNRFILAPLTNSQSNEDGTLSSEELHWLTMRAKGQFGIVMTCASHVQAAGKGFPGQLGIFSDIHIEGHQKLTAAIHKYDSLAISQLFHGGMRADPNLIDGDLVSASDIERKGARALTLDEVILLRDDFIKAALRAKEAGYDGIEVHGAHGYIISQFLSSEINKRTDKYGGSLENRSRLLFEIIHGIREACGKEYLIAVRLSPERFGMQLPEIVTLCQQLIDTENVDLLDVSLWDCFKYPHDEAFKEMKLLQYFEQLDFNNTIFTVAGKIRDGADVTSVLDANVDMVMIGRSAILHHDFPVKVMENNEFKSISNPVSVTHLREQGLSDTFIQYMCNWKGFVEDDHTAT